MLNWFCDYTLATLQLLWFQGDWPGFNETWPVEIVDTQAWVAVKVLDNFGMCAWITMNSRYLFSCNDSDQKYILN